MSRKRPYGRLSDLKGRKVAMIIAASFLICGDTWLWLTAYFPALQKAPLMMIAACLSGLGGGLSVIGATQSSFIADTSLPATRSFYLGLLLVMEYIANAVIPPISGWFSSRDLFGICFGAALVSRLFHFLYLVIIVRETRIFGAHSGETLTQTSEEETTETTGKSKLQEVIHSLFIQPLGLIVTNSTLLFFGIASFAKELAIGAFPVLVVYADNRFGLQGVEIGIIVSAMSVTRALAVLCVMPAVIYIYRRLAGLGTVQKTPTDPTERTPLLTENPTSTLAEGSGQGGPAATIETTVTIKQDLFIARMCFFIDVAAFFIIGRSNTPKGLAAGAIAGSLGAPANPSLRALITLAAGPSALGRVLAGFSIIESAAGVVRNPVMFGIYRATVHVSPTAIWYFCSGLFGLCGMFVWAVRPATFSGKTRVAV